MQKKVVRLITFNDGRPEIPGPLVSTLPLFYRLNILNIFDVFKLEINKFTFSVIRRLSPPQFFNMFTQINQINDIQTRASNQGNLYIHYVRTTNYGLTLVRSIGARLWNVLPNALKILPSKTQFKKILKNIFFLFIGSVNIV